MGAETAGRDAIVVRPRRGAWLHDLVARAQERPRDTIAGALAALTVLTGLVPAATTAAADGRPSLAAASAPAAQAAAHRDPLYPIVALPRPADGPIPLGKGMWVHKLNRAENGDVGRIVNQAKAAGLTHIYVRTGSSKSGFHGREDLDRLLPVAHAAGLKVVGWDFPYLHNVAADVERARQAIWYATPTGHRIDAFSPDIETRSEGTNLTAEAVLSYGVALRATVGTKYPLIATVPRPSPKRWFPYDQLGMYDAIAPMVYWGNRDPGADVAGAIAALAHLGKPVLPVGQAYDMAIDGARGKAAGAPSKQAVARFIKTATDHGALGVSFWVWDTADANHWAAIAEADQLDLAKPVYLQRVLTGLGHPTPVDGAVGPATTSAIAELQRREGLMPSGTLDPATVDALLKPRI